MLKRIASFILLGAMLLLLPAGCNAPITNDETTLPTEVTTEPTQATVPATTAPPPATLPPETTAPPAPQDFPMGTIGARTNGTLRSCTVYTELVCKVYPFGKNVLLCYPQQGRYYIVSLQDGSVLASMTDATWVNTVTVTDDQIIYYSLSERQITFLDMNLQVLKRVDVSVSDDVSDMKFSQDGTKAYYRLDYYNIGELNIETGEERVIPVYGPEIHSLSGLHFEDTVISYWGKNWDKWLGESYYAFVNVETGAYLGMDNCISRFRSWDNGYYLCRAQYGSVIEQRIVHDGAYTYMTPKDHGKRIKDHWVLPQLNSFFTLSGDTEKAELILDLYDLNTKRRTASITAPVRLEFETVSGLFCDPSGEYIWLILRSGTYPNYQMVLYRWDFKANAIEDTTVYGYGG